MKTFTTEAKVYNLSKVLAFIDNELDNAGCSVREVLQIDVAVEELFVNVSNYAYKPGTGDVTINIDILTDPSRAVITMIDSGIPYDPRLKEDPDISLPAERRRIGGLGIFMVKKSMDEVSYEYKDGHNIVTITKYLS